MTWLKSLVLVLRAHLFITGFLVFLVSAQREPKHTVNSFHNPPSRLFFFDDTTSVIYHDGIAGDVYVSHDEGKSWDRAEDIPKGYATMVFEHPFEKNYAFVLSSEKTHYRTTNRGKTWTKFEMPYEPTMAVAPLSFHSDPSKYGHILYQGTKCESTGGWGAKCKDVTYYTTDAFGDDPKLLLEDTINCHFAHSSTAFKHEAHPALIYCVAFDSSSHSGSRSSDSRRLFSSTDFFNKEKKMEDLGIGKQAKGVIAFAIVSKYAVVALKDSSHGEMMLFVTVDTKTWAKAQFPHASSAKLRENAYTLVESTTYSLAVDVVLQDYSAIGTLFVSNSNGTFFVQSLKDTNRNNYGYVDYEKIYGIEGVGLANIVSNAKDVEGRRAPKKLKTFITFDDGSNWYRVTPPELDNTGGRINCNPSNEENCSLHLHSVTALNNYGRVFSSPAPGLVMGIGSIGDRLLPYQECDTFLSTDGGLTWVMAKKEAHKHQIGGLGSIIVVVNDEEGVDKLSYSLDFGKSWKEYNFGVKLRAKGLTTLQDSTSQAFLLLGQVARKDRKDDLKSIAVIQLDFKDVFPRKCEDNDYEKWYARSSPDDRCFMGHQQWYMRRKQDADCYVDKKFEDPVGHDDPCKCTDADYECDYNYIRRGKECVAAGPEQVPQGVCTKPNQKYLGSSGYRKIPGNNCKGGIEKDKKVEKDCSEAQPEEGNIIHKTFEFPSQIIQHAYFNQSKTILVRLMDHTMWQSSNEGYTWEQLYPNERFLVFYHHKHNPDSAYLITSSRSLYVTTNVGQDWQKHEAPTLPNHLGLQVLRFHPDTEKLIWIGMEECPGPNCLVVAHSSRDNGRRWDLVEQYVRNCAWVRDHSLNADPTEILCESYRDKQGNQDRFKEENPLELVAGRNYFKDKKKVFDHVVGFAKFSEYLVVAELLPDKHAIDLQVSLDGIRFATGQFPPNIRPEAHAYTILESSTGSLFFHMTMSEPPAPYWGSILKSNGNGTYFGTSLDYVNRNEYGFVDFEKMAGLDGIALVNVVSNPSEATFSGQKQLRTKITHNDGSIWKPLNPPKTDSFGQKYECDDTQSCALHIHGYTERRDPRATYSSPSAVGILMAVGNVGKHLAPYHESDTFLSRDAGFTWEEIHKGAHLWEFGDSGSILVMADDEQPTDQILFSKDEGLTWHEYKFADEKIRVGGIVTVPSDTSRKFIVIGTRPRSSISVAVHIDFSALTLRQCQLSEDDPAHDDFELWTPSIEREEICLFGRKVTYHRRKRDVDCIVGTKRKPEVHVENCACKAVDFECEFNYVKNKNDECVLVEGTIPNPSDDSCKDGASYWYERTAYRKISYSSCQGGVELDHGTQHVCPGFSAHGPLFWMFTIMIPFSFTALVGYYYYRRSGLARGTIRLPADSRNPYYNDSGALATLASVPWFLFGLASIAWEWVAEQFDNVAMRTRRGYRHVPMEQDAQILRFEDEDG